MEFKETKHQGYFAGEDGHIYSTWRGGFRRLKGGLDGKGNYIHVAVRLSEKKFRTMNVHVLVCETFHGDRPPGMTASHIDGNNKNNRPDNLKWETTRQNLQRKLDHATDDCGHRNSRAKLSEDDIREIRKRLASGEVHGLIASDFSISRTVITRINNGTRYARSGLDWREF